MSLNRINPYNLDKHIAELYDQQENYVDDVELLLELIGDQGPMNIFEPFCGTGRILIPLVKAGHRLVGLDQSNILLGYCTEKLRIISGEAILIEGNALGCSWPTGFDLVVLGGNCLYELANSEEQKSVIRASASALRPGGFLFLDNGHMEGELAKEWQDTSLKKCFPSGLCRDEVRLESTMQTIWFDAAARLAHFQRKTRIIFPDGHTVEQAYMQQKHPISTVEVSLWLENYGFIIKRLYGSRLGQPYTETSPRAIFWAQKTLANCID